MKMPVTPAVRALRAANVTFEPHLYRYEARGGTAVSARELGVPEEQVVKTLVMEDDTGAPLIVLMDGTHEVSTKKLARRIGVKSVSPCSPAGAQKHTGYLVGGTSPFGTRDRMPVYADRRVFGPETVYINGGKRGFLVALAVADLRRLLEPIEVDVAV